MNLFERAKGFFTNSGEKAGEEVAVVATVASYTNLGAPLTYEEMQLLVPPEIRSRKHPKHKAVYGLLQETTRFMEDSRRISQQPVHKYLLMKANVPAEIRVRGVQEQMGATMFRLDNYDFNSIAERNILKSRLHELYQVAKQIDPVGVSRYERSVDKHLRKSR